MKKIQKNWLGKLETNIKGLELSTKYNELFTSDLKAAKILIDNELYNQAAYLLIQTIEKMLRSKIFSKVNGDLEYYRERNRSHDISDGIDFLIDITGFDELTKKGIKEQLNCTILETEIISRLNNNLRYPSYSNKFKSYSLLVMSRKDINRLLQMINNLESYLERM
uniref:HEPN domain-containing protein n=1 Tax=uncultured Tenacibaculum sp. TaxID=174713 RepID=UPI00260A1122|nr:HEPN domain-containing protein [uncultured Tenacibaculum sp.]